jgi:hypothetical protein
MTTNLIVIGIILSNRLFLSRGATKKSEINRVPPQAVRMSRRPCASDKASILLGLSRPGLQGQFRDARQFLPRYSPSGLHGHAVADRGDIPGQVARIGVRRQFSGDN